MLIALPIETGKTPDWGTPEVLFQTPFAGGTYAGYTVDRDGQRFVLPLPPGPEEATPITVIVNWTGLLPR
jgi:hypothetical protein